MDMNLPALPLDPRALAGILKQTAREAVPSMPFLRMGKDGIWTFGVEAEEIDSSMQFAVNVSGFAHGYVVWAEAGSEKLAETIAPLHETLPQNGPLPAGGRAWEFQLGAHFKGYSGALKDQEMTYRTSSVGGKRAVVQLAQQIAQKLTTYADNKKEDAIMPIITLGSDSYRHKSYGKIFVPEFNIVKWVRMPTNGAGAPVEEAPAKTPAKRGRR